MRRRGLYVAVLTLSLFLSAVVSGNSVSALGLKLSPLEYKTELAKGEKKKGFIDLSNPTTQKLRIKTSVQAFRQIDDKGSLEFYDTDTLKVGIKLDLDEFELGPREAIRMYFQLDGTKLPQGDVYAAVFFSTQAPDKVTSGVGQQVRLGTLLSIVNVTPGSRQAEIVSVNTPFVQFGDTIKGTYVVKNTGDPNKTTGFYPDVTTRVSPFGDSKKQTGKLVFAGRAREHSFTLKAPLIGFYNVGAEFGQSSKSTLVFVAQPVALLGLLGLIVIAIMLFAWRRRRSGKKRLFKKK